MFYDRFDVTLDDVQVILADKGDQEYFCYEYNVREGFQ